MLYKIKLNFISKSETVKAEHLSMQYALNKLPVIPRTPDIFLKTINNALFQFLHLHKYNCCDTSLASNLFKKPRPVELQKHFRDCQTFVQN